MPTVDIPDYEKAIRQGMQMHDEEVIVLGIYEALFRKPAANGGYAVFNDLDEDHIDRWSDAAWDGLLWLMKYNAHKWKTSLSVFERSERCERTIIAQKMLGYMIKKFPVMAVRYSDNFRDLLDIIRDKRLIKGVRHSLSWFVLSSAVNRNCVEGLKRGQELAASQVIEDVYVVPARTSGYLHPIFAMFESNGDVLCNSACQFKSPKGILKYWHEGEELNGSETPQVAFGVPALFHTLSALHDNATTARKKEKAAKSIISAARYLKDIRRDAAYRAALQHIPVGLQEKLSR
ncbi:MAG: hypothetical protein AB7G06_05975 [Bdellovibrionales bacterium]